MNDETPIYHELLNAYYREHRLHGQLIAATYADHYAHHEGPIQFCDAEACRTAWAAA